MHWYSPSRLFEDVIHFTFYCSILALLLPPAKMFARLPRFAAAYETFVDLVQYWGSLNLRSKLYGNGANGQQSQPTQIFKFPDPQNQNESKNGGK